MNQKFGLRACSLCGFYSPLTSKNMLVGELAMLNSPRCKSVAAGGF